MPLTSKGQQILEAMKNEYGAEKGERVFYASKNAGRISGVDSQSVRTMKGDVVQVPSHRGDMKQFHDSYMDSVRRGDGAQIKAHSDRLQKDRGWG